MLSGIEIEGTRLFFDVNDIGLRINALGEYNALNACAAVAVGEICGVDRSSIGAQARPEVQYAAPAEGR